MKLGRRVVWETQHFAWRIKEGFREEVSGNYEERVLMRLTLQTEGRITPMERAKGVITFISRDW